MFRCSGSSVYSPHRKQQQPDSREGARARLSAPAPACSGDRHALHAVYPFRNPADSISAAVSLLFRRLKLPKGASPHSTAPHTYVAPAV
jgi:hypothetical protein